jgi:hypothetical protein
MYEDFHYTTDAEWDRAEAREQGENNPDQAWVLTNRDVWHANPFYKGPAVPHPEEEVYDFLDDLSDAEFEELYGRPPAGAVEYTQSASDFDDDIPF